MSLSPRATRIWRIAILGMGLFDALHVWTAAWITRGQSRAAIGWAGFLMAHPLLLGLVVGLYAYASYRFVRRSSELSWGVLAFALLWLLVRIWTSSYTTGHQDFIQGGAALLGWLLGAVWARLLGLRPSESAEAQAEADRYAATGALALFSATYVCAGTSKLINSDLQWTSAATIRLMAISHLPVGQTSWLTGLKQGLAQNPHAGTVLQWATVGIQLGAFLLLLGKWPRLVWGTMIVLLHTGIYLSSGIVFLTPLVLAGAFAFPWHPRGAAGDVGHPLISADRVRRVLRGAVLGTIGILALVWLTPLGPALRFQAQPWQIQPPKVESPDHEPPAPPQVLALLGDLSVGEVLAGCAVRQVTGPSEGRISVHWDCPRGPATLWVLRRDDSPMMPPGRTKRLDIQTRGNGAGGGPTAEDLAALVVALAARIKATGETAELPAGL